MISFTDKVQGIELLGHISAYDSTQLPLLGVLVQKLDNFSQVVHWQQWDDDIFCSNCNVLVEGCHMIFSTLNRVDDTWDEVRLD